MSKFYKNIPESESFSFVFDKGLISTLNNFSFDFLGFDSLNSETKSSFGFLLSGGRVFDYKNRYVYSLNSDDQILISGNFINGCYANYSINGERIFSDKIFDSGNSFTGFSLKYDDGAFDDCSFVVGVGDNNCDIYYDKYIESFIGKKSYSNIRIGSVENKLLINDVYIPDFAINRRFFSLTGLQNYQFPIYLDKSGFIDIQLIISELNRDQYNWIPLFIDTQFGVV